MAAGSGRIGVPELQLGVPFPAVAMEILRQAASGVEARRLVLTGRLLEPEEAVAGGLVDEVVAPDELLDRAVAEAESLARVPAVTFGLTKRQLGAASARRLEREGAEVDREVLEIWSRPEILAGIRSYIERTFKRPSG